MRAHLALLVAARLTITALALAEPHRKTASPTTAPDLPGLSALRGAGGPTTPVSRADVRQRETFENLPLRARAIHAVLSKGGQLSLAGGSVVAQVERDGRIALVGPVSTPWVDADRALRHGGQLTVDDEVTLLVQNEHLEEARVRTEGATYVLTPPTGQTVRTVGIFRESAPALAAGAVLPDQQPRPRPAALPVPALLPGLPIALGSRSDSAHLTTVTKPEGARARDREQVPARPTAPTDPTARPTAPPAQSIAASSSPSAQRTGARAAEPAGPPRGATVRSGATGAGLGSALRAEAPGNERAHARSGLIDDEIRTIADIDAQLRETRVVHAALLRQHGSSPALSLIDTDLDVLARRVADLWKEADAVLHLSHRLVTDEAISSIRSAALDALAPGSPREDAGARFVSPATDEPVQSASAMPTPSR